MNPFVENLLHERAELDRQIRDDPRHQKIAKIDELLAVYGIKPDASPRVIPVLRARVSPHGRKGKPARAVVRNKITDHPTAGMPKESKEKLVKARVIAFLGKNGTNHRKEILAELNRAGLMGHEKKPLGSLAIYLSRWKDEIIGVGDGNYRLADPTPSGSDNESNSGGSDSLFN